MVFAVVDVAICSSCYSANVVFSFYRTVSQDLDIFNTRACNSYQNSSTIIISSSLYLCIVESDVLDAALFCIAEETGFAGDTDILRDVIDVEISDGLPVAVKCTLVHIFNIIRVTDRSPTDFFSILGAILRMAELCQVNIFSQRG